AGEPFDQGRGQGQAASLRGRKPERAERGVTMSLRLWVWGQSDPGRKRERNEDSYLVDPETGVMAVADGMGGHQGGATASRMAVEYLGRELSEARGNFEQALMAQIQATARVTEEMLAVSDTGEQEAVNPRDVHRRAL